MRNALSTLRLARMRFGSAGALARWNFTPRTWRRVHSSALCSPANYDCRWGASSPGFERGEHCKPSRFTVGLNTKNFPDALSLAAFVESSTKGRAVSQFLLESKMYELILRINLLHSNRDRKEP